MDFAKRMDLVGKLYKDAAFIALKCNRERIAYTLDKMIDFDTIVGLVRTNLEAARQKASKNLEVACNYKAEAEQLLHVGDQDLALRAVTKALLYAPPNEARLKSSLYGLKANIHYEQENFVGALYSAHLACESLSACDYSQKDTEQAMMKLQCLVKLRRYRSALQLVDLLLEKEKHNPTSVESESVAALIKMKKTLTANDHCEDYTPDRDSAIKTDYFSYRLNPCCKIECSPVVGRHFVATTDIAAGTLLLEERPYSIVVEAEYLLKKCNSCHIELKHRFYPCEFCTEVAFCDPDCFREAWSTYHRHECGISAVLRGITSPSFHVFRMHSRIGPMEAFAVESNFSSFTAKDYRETRNMKEYSIDTYLAEARQRDTREKDKTRHEKCRAYKMSSILWDHDEKHNDHSNAYHTVIGIETTALLDLVHGIRHRQPDQQFLLRFTEIVVFGIRRIVFNVFGWHEYNEDWTVRGHVANCQCLVGSLINHSCVPNTNWDWKDGVIQFTTKTAIPKGTEITITYGPSKDMSYYKRQERLNHYFFVCKCAACATDSVKGENLRCRNCGDGPVVFASAVNLEKFLSGKCANCYHGYGDYFESAIAELRGAQSSATMINSASGAFNSESMLARTIELCETMINLSLRESIAVCRAILACSQTIEQYDLRRRFDLHQRLQLALLLDRSLPTVLDASLIDHKSIASLQYWFVLLSDDMIRVMDDGQSDDSSADDDRTHQRIDRKKVWDALLQFHQRFCAALNEIGKKQNCTELLQEMVQDRLAKFDKRLNDCRVAYARKASFISL